MGLGEQIGDLLAGADVPVRHPVLLHLLLRPLRQAAALPHRLHDLEGALGVHPLGDQEQHDVVPATDGLADLGGARGDQVLGVAQPHVGSVGEAGQADQDIELVGLGVLQHPPDEGGAELRDGSAAGGPQDLVVLIAQHLGGLEDRHGLRVIQWDLLGVHPSQVLKHSDHSGVIVSQHVQLQQVGLHGVIFEVGGDDIGIGVVRRVLYGTEVIDLLVLGDDHHAAGVLAGGALDAGAADGQAVLLRLGGRPPPLLQVLLHIAESRLFRHRTNGPGSEHVGLSKQLKGVPVGAGLVLAGEVQVDIGHLVSPEAQKGLEGDVEAVLHIGRAADGTVHIGHIRPAPVGVGGVLGVVKVRVLALGAAVVGGQGVDLSDARHECHQRGAHRSTGAHQIAVLQGVLHQLLGGHVDHVVLAADDIPQLHVDAVHHDLGRLLAVELMGLAPYQPLQLPVGVLKLGGKQSFGQGLNGLAPVRDEIGIPHHHVVGGLLPQIGKFLQHLGGGLEVDGQGLVRVLKALGGQKDVAVDLVLRVQEVDVTGGAHRLAQLLPQGHDGPVEVPQLLLCADHPLAEHEHIVAQGLDLQIIVPGGDALELLPVLAVRHRPEELARLAGGAQDQPLPVLVDDAFEHDGVTLEVVQMSQGDELVQVTQTGLVPRQHDQVLGLALGLSSLAQVDHGPVDLPQVAQAHLLQHLKERGQHVAHRGRVVAGPVVIEGGQVQVLRHDVQLVLAQVRQQVLGQDQAVDGGIVEGNAVFPAAGGDKAHVEVGVVGRQGPVPGKSQESPQGLLLGGSPHQHLIGDTGQADDLRTQDAAGGDKGVEPVGDLPVFQHYGANLDDDLVLPVQPCGLDVEADDLLVKGLFCFPVDHYSVIHVVDVVRLHAVQDLDIFGGVPRIREGLGHPVIGDGDGPVAPGLRPLDHVFVRPQLGTDRGEGVHSGHGGVQVELHPLFRRVIHLHRLGHRHDGHGLQHHVAVEPVHVQPALDLEVHPLLDPVHDGLALVSGEEFVHPNGAGVVGQIEGHHPGAPLFQLPVVHGKDIALDDHHAHVQLQLPDGGRPLLDDMPENRLAGGLALPFSLGSGRRRAPPGLPQRLPPNGLRPREGVHLRCRALPLPRMGRAGLGRGGRHRRSRRCRRFGGGLRLRGRHLKLH